MRNKNIVVDCVVCSTKKMVDNQHPLLLFGAVEVYRKVYTTLYVCVVYTRTLVGSELNLYITSYEETYKQERERESRLFYPAERVVVVGERVPKMDTRNARWGGLSLSFLFFFKSPGPRVLL